MAATDVDVANLALGHLGITVPVATISGVATKEERAVKTAYVVIRDLLQRRYPWKFNFKRAALVLVDPLVAAEVTTLDEWTFAYKQPSDCLAPVRIVSSIRNEAPDQRIPFEPGYSDTGATPVVMCDVSSAVLQYRQKVTDCTRFSPGYELAFSYALAVEMAMPLRTDANITKLTQALATMKLAEALADERSVGVPDQAPDAEYIRARA